MKLSVIIITKNEAANIAACLKSVAFADEFIVVDSGSTDGTVELAQALGARVEITSDWPGFGPQKNRALDLATGDWILSIDADERVTPELAREIQEALRAPRADAYEIARLSNFCGRDIRHSGWWPDYVLRLYASPAYLDEHPPIRSREDLAEHRFVSYVDDLLFSKELLFLDGIADPRSVGLRSTSLLAQQEAVAMGAGIAILPAFSADADPRLRLLLPEEVSFTRTFWMLMPIEFKDLARMRTTWDYLKEMAQQNQGRLLGQA